jgi:hypothetical protein
MSFVAPCWGGGFHSHFPFWMLPRNRKVLCLVALLIFERIMHVLSITAGARRGVGVGGAWEVHLSDISLYSVLIMQKSLLVWHLLQYKS